MSRGYVTLEVLQPPLGTDGRFRVANSQLFQMLGYTEDELTRLTFVDITHPDHVTQDLEAVRSLYAGEIPYYKAEKRYIKKNGDILWGNLTAAAIRDAEGKLLYTLPMIEDITDRKRAEEALRESEEKYRLFVETANEAVFVAQDGVLRFANRRCMELTGYPEAELLSKPMIDFIDPDDREMVVQYHQRRLRGDDAPDTYSFRIIDKDGDIKWLELKSALITWAGSPAVLCFASDITDRTKAEKALRESELRYRSLFENMSNAVAVYKAEQDGEDFILAHFNAAGERIEKTDKGEVIGQSVLKVFPGVREFGLFDVFRRVWRTGEPERHPVALYRDEKIEGWRDNFVYKLPTGEIVAVYSDETDRKRAEEELQKQVSLMESLLEAIPAPVFFKDTNHIYLGCNEAFAEFIGLPKENIIGKSVFEVAPIELADVYKAQDEALFNNPIPQIYESSVKSSDGTTHDVMAHKATFADSSGSVAGLIGVILDITDRKRAEEALRESEEKLRLVTESIEDVFWMTTPGIQEMTYVSPAYERLWGRTRASLYESPKSFMESIHPEDREQLLRVVEEHQERAWTCEYRIVRPDGTIRWIHDRGYPILDESGNIRLRTGISTDITDRKKAEEALRESEEKYRLLFEKGKDAVVFHEVDSLRFVDVNPAAEALWGYTRSELMTMTPVDLSLEPDKTREALEQATKPGGTQVPIRWQRKKDGSSIAVEISASHSFTWRKRNVLCSIVRDITDRKKSEEALRESEERFRLAMEATNDGVWDWDLKTDHVFRSPGFFSMLGYGEEEFGGRFGEWQNLVHPEDLKAVLQSLNEYLNGTTENYEVEFRMLDKSGDPVWILSRGKVVARDAHGEPLRMLGTHTDVTGRKRAEEALKESDKQYRTLFEDSIDGVYSVLRDGTITDANPSFCELFGYTRGEMIGKDIRDLYSEPTDRPRFQKEIEKTGFVKDYEVKFRKRDGTEVDCLISSSVHFGEDGSITGYRGIVRDLTARKELHRQLRQAQKMEAIGTLAGGVAHDFNNILQVTLGYSELILGDEELPGHYRADLQKIHESARRGADLIQRLLTFSRKTEIKPQPLNLNRRIGELSKMLERTIPKMIDIRVFPGGNLATINADPTQIDQVLMNLAVNARDAMPEGGKLTVETANITLDEDYAKTHLDAKPGRYVLLMVTDTGAGMDKETLGHIFEPFFTTKALGEGTGLGLAMVHGIVKQHGGLIWAYSEPGAGTTFKIYFPALVSDEEQEETTIREMPRGGPETILMVDDEELIRDLGSRILTKAGYKVIGASNGKEALEVYQARSDEIALVILDLIMPDMGGEQCLKGLLSLDPAVKVVIASGFAANGPTKDALVAGARGFVNKPYDIRQVMEVVRNTLDAE
jgi:two-component system, cell cycle sensor histidine kinase and response regulator CckA